MTRAVALIGRVFPGGLDAGRRFAAGGGRFALWAFSIRVAAAGLAFVTQIVLARLIGEDAYGEVAAASGRCRGRDRGGHLRACGTRARSVYVRALPRRGRIRRAPEADYLTLDSRQFRSGVGAVAAARGRLAVFMEPAPGDSTPPRHASPWWP